MSKVDKYPWRGSYERSDLILMGEPDCHAYIVRYQSARYGNAYCWWLTMPRGAFSERRSGWASSMPAARRQVEKSIKDNWGNE
jgi:hypothetical protein